MNNQSSEQDKSTLKQELEILEHELLLAQIRLHNISYANIPERLQGVKSQINSLQENISKIREQLDHMK